VRILKFLPAIVWTAVILVLLLSEASGLPKFWWLQFPFSDKLIHAGVFAIGSLLLVYAMQTFKDTVVAISVASWALTLALSTEYYQHCCVASRTGEWADLLADVVGAALPLLLFKYWRA
jgi:VanZ family protein